MKDRLKRLIFRLLGKDPEPVVVILMHGDQALAERMREEVAALLPTYRHIVWSPTLPAPSLRPHRIGMVAALVQSPGVRLALLLAPFRFLAYNSRLERLHLRWYQPITAWLFLRGVALDRVRLRPSWLYPFKRDRTREIATHRIVEGRATSNKPRIAILTPYAPYPLSHGGAVRMYQLLTRCARDFDLWLFTFADSIKDDDREVMQKTFAKIIVFPQPYYREPHWSTLQPAPVQEFASSYVDATLRRIVQEDRIGLTQIEYTQLATYPGEILVEHDVTFDLFDQIARHQQTWASRWDAWRWRHFEISAVRRYRRVVAMSSKDKTLIDATDVIPNGVDLERYTPMPDADSLTVLFVGSFRHFPNVRAFEFFYQEIWPLILAAEPDARFLVIAGPEPEQHATIPHHPSLELHAFVSDVRPFYARARCVVVPTIVSAGTNLKVLEALACGRAVVSTTSGAAGLDLIDRQHLLIRDTPAAFSEAVIDLLRHSAQRESLAQQGRREVEARFGWDALAGQQRKLWQSLL